MKAEALGADCQNCSLRSAPYVPTKHPQGPPQSDGAQRIAVVGEAPGFNEATYGQPFTGPSGKLLTRVLNHHKIRRDEVLLTNVTLCRPEGNATPPRDAIRACSGRLKRELLEFGPTDILALGGTAGTLLAEGSGTITTLRVGPPKRASGLLDDGAGSRDRIRVVPTWHPAYCLRTADAFPALVRDVGKLKETKLSAWTEPKWRAFDDPAQALEVIRRLSTLEGPLVVDIEVGIDKDDGFDHPNKYSLLCVGICYARGRAVVLGESALADPNVVNALRVLFRTKRLIGHNGKFDLSGLYPHLGPLELWFDTMLASYALNEVPGGHSLGVLGVERLGSPDWKHEIKKYIPKRGNYANIPRPILYKYNAFDVCNTWGLYELFVDELERQGLRKVHDFMVAAANQLMYLELNGITIDQKYMAELSAAYLERLEGIETEMDMIVSLSTGHLDDGAMNSINPRSPMQVKKYLLSQGVKVESTNQETLEALLELLPKGSAKRNFVTVLLRYRRQHKLYSTYISGIRKRMYRGRIYTTYLLHGTTSGRLASRNPNMQNIVRDKEIRRQFSVSRPGNVLIQADYANAEARVMATLAQDEYLRTILSNQTPGYKFFNELSDQLYGEGQWGKEEYIRTKAFFYGIAYGRESWSIAQEYGMSASEGEKRYRDFLGLFPGVSAWQEDVKKHVLSMKPLETPFGRRRRFWLITDQNKKDVVNEALSYLPQSTASDICLSALIRVRPMLRGLGFLRLTIHDALVAECAEERQDEVSELLRTVMAEEGARFTDYVPFPVDVSVGTSWGDL
jgi:uracil-DNA glycosylase family 4